MSLPQGYVEFAELRARFGVWLRVMGRSPATVRAYLAAVDRWWRYADSPLLDHWKLQRFLASRRETVATASVNMDIKGLKAWQRWLGFAAPDMAPEIPMPRQRRPPDRPVQFLTDGEVGLLLAEPDLTTFTGLRDHVIIATLYQCGLRASELASLQLGSVLEGGLLYVQGKGGRDRYVPYGEAWAGLLSGYLRARTTVRPGKRAALFVTKHGRPLRDGRSVWVIVDRYARRALGIGCGYTRLQRSLSGRPWRGHYPHLLRASFATVLHERGVDLMSIAQMLGHASVETTTRYLGISMTELRKAAACHPRALRSPADADHAASATESVHTPSPTRVAMR